MQLVKAAGRLGLAVATVLATVVLTGCDAVYDVVIENHMDQEVTVSVAKREYRLGPCSVRIVAAVTAAPFGSIPLDIQDTDGGSILRLTTVSKGSHRPRSGDLTLGCRVQKTQNREFARGSVWQISYG